MIASLPLPPPDDIRVVGEPAEDELAHIWLACDPGCGALTRGSLTFRGPASKASDAATSAAWASWLTSEFITRLAPDLREAREHAANGRIHELRALDVRLGEGYDAHARERLSAAGRALLEGMLSMRAVSWPRKFLSWAEAGECPALFPTIFAARCAVFHLSPRTTLIGYALCEWRAGRPRSSDACELARALAATDAVWRVLRPVLSPIAPSTAAA